MNFCAARLLAESNFLSNLVRHVELKYPHESLETGTTKFKIILFIHEQLVDQGGQIEVFKCKHCGCYY